MDKVVKRLFGDLRRLEVRVKHIEGLLSVDSGMVQNRSSFVSSESNHPGGAGAGTNAAQATASPGCLIETLND